jgi:hypothetical protein
MNRQEFEQMLITDLVDGNAYDITSQMKPENYGQELADLMETWATFQSDPHKLQAAMKRHLVGLVNRILEEKNLPEYEPTKEDRYYEFHEHLREQRNDRRMERES